MFVFKLVNRSLASNVMSIFPMSISRGRLLQIWRCLGRWTPALQKLFTWTTPVIAMLKELAPYAAIELLLPGGSLMALTLWFYRRRKRAPADPETVSIVRIT